MSHSHSIFDPLRTLEDSWLTVVVPHIWPTCLPNGRPVGLAFIAKQIARSGS